MIVCRKPKGIRLGNALEQVARYCEHHAADDQHAALEDHLRPLQTERLGRERDLMYAGSGASPRPSIGAASDPGMRSRQRPGAPALVRLARQTAYPPAAGREASASIQSRERPLTGIGLHWMIEQASAEQAASTLAPEKGFARTTMSQLAVSFAVPAASLPAQNRAELPGEPEPSSVGGGAPCASLGRR